MEKSPRKATQPRTQIPGLEFDRTTVNEWFSSLPDHQAGTQETK